MKLGELIGDGPQIVTVFQNFNAILRLTARGRHVLNFEPEYLSRLKSYRVPILHYSRGHVFVALPN